MLLTVNDRHSFNITKRVVTDEGFLRVPGRVSRTGIQEYLARELDLKDRDPNAIVNIYRPDDEVFNVDSLNSFCGSDVTLEHPRGLVDAETYRSVSVGVVKSPGRKDGDFVIADLIIKDNKAIQAVNDGKVQLSAGYTAVYDMTPGKTPDGQPYDGIQTNIMINHVALVERARAGAQARIFDGDKKVSMKTIVLDSGRKIELEDNEKAVLIADTIERLQNEIETQSVIIDAQVEKIAALEEFYSPEKMAEKIKEISTALDSARKKAGKAFNCDSMNLVDIHKTALSIVRPNLVLDGKSPEFLQGAFDSLEEKETDEEEKETNEEEKETENKKASNDSYKQFSQDSENMFKSGDNTQTKKTSYDNHKDWISNAWKKGA